MNLIKLIAANKYFSKRTKKVYCTDALTFFPSEMSKYKGYGKLLPFQMAIMKKKFRYRKWVKHNLCICYNHCSSLLLGLDLQDKCVFGKLDYHTNENFYHAWNEFKFNNAWYVYDCQNNFVYEKEHYYRKTQPTIIKSWTLSEVLNRYQNYKTTENGKEKIVLPRFKSDIGEKIENIPALKGYSFDFFYRDAEITFKNNQITSVKVNAWDLD